MLEDEEQVLIVDQEHDGEQDDDLNNFQIGEEHDVDGLWYISIFDFSELPKLENYFGRIQNIIKKWSAHLQKMA